MLDIAFRCMVCDFPLRPKLHFVVYDFWLEILQELITACREISTCLRRCRTKTYRAIAYSSERKISLIRLYKC